MKLRLIQGSLLLWSLIILFPCELNAAIVSGYWQNGDIWSGSWTGSDLDDYGRYLGNISPSSSTPYNLTNFYAYSDGSNSSPGQFWVIGQSETIRDATITGQWSTSPYYAGGYHKWVTLYTSPISGATLTLKGAGPWSDNGSDITLNMTGYYSVYQGNGLNDYIQGKTFLEGYSDNYHFAFYLAMSETNRPVAGDGRIRVLWPSVDGSTAWFLEIRPIPIPSAAWLLGSVLASIVGIRKLKRNRHT